MIARERRTKWKDAKISAFETDSLLFRKESARNGVITAAPVDKTEERRLIFVGVACDGIFSRLRALFVEST